MVGLFYCLKSAKRQRINYAVTNNQHKRSCVSHKGRTKAAKAATCHVHLLVTISKILNEQKLIVIDATLNVESVLLALLWPCICMMHGRSDGVHFSRANILLCARIFRLRRHLSASAEVYSILIWPYLSKIKSLVL